VVGRSTPKGSNTSSVWSSWCLSVLSLCKPASSVTCACPRIARWASTQKRTTDVLFRNSDTSHKIQTQNYHNVKHFYDKALFNCEHLK
jgi:hypothetical protein